MNSKMYVVSKVKRDCRFVNLLLKLQFNLKGSQFRFLRGVVVILKKHLPRKYCSKLFANERNTF